MNYFSKRMCILKEFFVSSLGRKRSCDFVIYSPRITIKANFCSVPPLNKANHDMNCCYFRVKSGALSMLSMLCLTDDRYNWSRGSVLTFLLISYFPSHLKFPCMGLMPYASFKTVYISFYPHKHPFMEA